MSIDRTMIEIAINCDLYEQAETQSRTRQFANFSDYIANLIQNDLVQKNGSADQTGSQFGTKIDTLNSSKLANCESLSLVEQRGTEVHADVRELLRKAASESAD